MAHSAGDDDSGIVPKLRKFRPKIAIEIVTSDLPRFVRTWALVRLFGWVYFDQRAGRRNKGKSELRTGNARQLGHIALAYLLDREREGGQSPDEDLQDLMELFLRSGGFGAFLNTRRGAVGFLARARKKEKELKYVHEIVAYLCRHRLHGLDGRMFTLEYAKRFVQQLEPIYQVRTVSKYWESNKQAAPYTFGFLAEFSTAVAKARSVGELILGLEQLAGNRELMKKLAGAAAHGADVLQAAARNVRVKDFKRVDRVMPMLSPFGDAEVALLNNIDVHALPKSDLHDYRPKALTRSR